MSAAQDSWIRFLTAVALIGGAGLFLRARSGAENLPSRQPLSSFPMQVGDWTGRSITLDADTLRVLGDGEFLQRIYRHQGAQPPIDFFLAYFPTQRTGSTIHSPQNCLPGAGWVPLESGLMELSDPKGRKSQVNRYVLGKGLDRELVLYWYLSHGRVVASEYWAKIYLVTDSIRMNRSDGALVRVITPLAHEETSDGAEKRAVQFAQMILPTLDGYVPN